MPDSPLMQRLADIEESLSVSHKRIAAFLLNSGHKAAFMTAAEIASHTEASESTVVRFARILKFRGFPELQDYLRRDVLDTLSPVERLAKQGEITDQAHLVEHLIERESTNLRAALRDIDSNSLQELTTAICSARTCYVVGLRSSRAPAVLLGHYLTKMLPQVVVIVSSDFILDQLSWADENDVLIAYSFPRYSKPTIDAMRIAKSAGAKTAAISDSRSSPAAQLSDFSLIAPSISDFYGNSFVAAVAVTNLLLASCVQAQPDTVRKNLRRLEEVASLSERFFRLPDDLGDE
jgi:DNA-binding MurR/RpiR family transcriptional regulator